MDYYTNEHPSITWKLDESMEELSERLVWSLSVRRRHPWEIDTFLRILKEHGSHFLICGDCGAVAELCDTEIDRAIARGAAQAGFAVRTPVVEIQGRCPECRNGEA